MSHENGYGNKKVVKNNSVTKLFKSKDQYTHYDGKNMSSNFNGKIDQIMHLKDTQLSRHNIYINPVQFTKR